MKHLSRIRFPAGHEDHARAFIRLLDEAARLHGHRPSQTLATFLDLSFRTLRGTTLVGAAWRENEDHFLREESRLQERAALIRLFAQMLGHIGLALAENPSDFIGPVFSELAYSSELGQFFTPPDVSRLIAKIQLADLPAVIAKKDDGVVRFSEPTCGVGGMILAATGVAREMQIDIGRHIHWVGVEIDYRAMCAAYIQTYYAGIPAHIILGNSLTLEERLVSITPAAIVQEAAVRRLTLAAAE